MFNYLEQVHIERADDDAESSDSLYSPLVDARDLDPESKSPGSIELVNYSKPKTTADIVFDCGGLEVIDDVRTDCIPPDSNRVFSFFSLHIALYHV